MKIVHVCLSCFYIDGFSFQENELVKQHIALGHEVCVVASTENYNQEGQLTYTKPSSYIGLEGERVIRIPYRIDFMHSVAKKLRMHPGVWGILEKENPDVVMFHGICGWELLTVVKFIQANPHIIFHIDSHEDYYNSARGFVSRFFLHGIYYKYIIKKALKYLPPVLCVSIETMQFVHEMYGVPLDKVSFFPLGGNIFGNKEYSERRKKGREIAGLKDDQIMFLQTGKMGKRKKLIDSLSAFTETKNDKFRLILVGHISDEIKVVAEKYIMQDSRIQFLGWKNVEDLQNLLCATDVYLQPGTQSATMQMSLCARCPVILDDVPSHKPYIKGNGWVLNDKVSLPNVFSEIALDQSQLQRMSLKSLEVAQELLDYKTLASRVLSRS